MISSTSNQKVKQAAALAKKAKYRTETGLFVVEGPKMAAELPDDRIQQVYVTEHFLEEEKGGSCALSEVKTIKMCRDCNRRSIKGHV